MSIPNNNRGNNVRKGRGNIGKIVIGFLAVNVFIVVVCVLIALDHSTVWASEQVAAEVGSHERSWGFLSAALAVGLGSISSAIAVAVIGSSALGAMSEKPELGGKAIIFLGLAEGIAIYGLIVAILIMGKI